jgi:hypothetical protein
MAQPPPVCAHLCSPAGVAQWQSSSLPSWLCGFDSRHPLSPPPALVRRPLRRLPRSANDPDQVVAAKLQRQPLPVRLDHAVRIPVGRTGGCRALPSSCEPSSTGSGRSSVCRRLGIIRLGVELDITPQSNFALYNDVAKVETFIRRVVPHRRRGALVRQDRGRVWAAVAEGDAARRLSISAADELPHR